jgi:nucleotidyltransferase substrate binding protein (TIGR01987 family)
MSEINYNKFENSLKRLEERYKFYQKNKDNISNDIDITESIKESCIQRFEICLDTAWKHIKKYLEDELGRSDLPNSPNPIFKEAFANKLILDAEIWIEFNENRRNSSHDYSGEKADNTFEIIADFILEAIEIYQKMTGQKWQN